MKKILAVLMLCLSGCALTPTVNNKFPTITPELLAACPDLKTIDQTDPTFSDVLVIVVNNYTMYKECQNKVNSWIDWYNSQQKVYETTK